MESEVADIKGRLTNIEAGLQTNTDATLENGKKLEGHIQRTEAFAKKLAPAGAAIDYYQDGVRAIGAIGHAVRWCAKWAARFLKFFAPVAAAFAAVYATWPSESRALFELLKFWNWFKH